MKQIKNEEIIGRILRMRENYIEKNGMIPDTILIGDDIYRVLSVNFNNYMKMNAPIGEICGMKVYSRGKGIIMIGNAVILED